MEQSNQPPRRPSGIPPVRRPAPPRPIAHSAAPMPAGKSKKSLVIAMVAITIVSALIVLGAGYMGLQKFLTNASVKGGKNNYQAVFLSNNMVYFGKLSNVTGEYVVLSDIYYLQLQNQNGQNNQQNQNNQQQPQVSLTKLGNELHGPEDIMYINKKQIMFWENLKDDSKVTQAIQNYQSQNKK